MRREFEPSESDVFQDGESGGLPFHRGFPSLLLALTEKFINVLVRKKDGSSDAVVFYFSSLHHTVELRTRNTD